MGVDEVGRGCLAGSVFAAAVILPREEEHEEWISKITDSKKISAKKREYLADLIMKYSVWYVSYSSPSKIDKINILNATLETMREAVEAASLIQEPDVVLVDGNKLIPNLKYPQECIKSGDSAVKAIGAASIIAKVMRDAEMSAFHSIHPEYGWVKNKGYGTKEHRQAIMVHGVTELHRRSFKGVAEYV
ncbi:MAG: ribonuclease HII [Candidatus Altiarchaeales archaeon]|nr:ribonuclease HII [Candidatus Altiarchaeales archaeon]